MKIRINILALIIFISPAYSQGGPDFFWADSSHAMPGDTFEVSINYQFPYPQNSISILPFVLFNFEVDDFSLERGLLEGLNCDITFVPGDTFLFSANCEIPPIYEDTLLLNFKMVCPTNMPPGLYDDWFYGMIVDQYGWYFEDTALVSIEIGELEWERGDLNHDSTVASDDLQILLDYVYYIDPFEPPIGVGDVNADGVIDIEDVLYLRNIIFHSRR